MLPLLRCWFCVCGVDQEDAEENEEVDDIDIALRLNETNIGVGAPLGLVPVWLAGVWQRAARISGLGLIFAGLLALHVRLPPPPDPASLTRFPELISPMSRRSAWTTRGDGVECG